MYRIMIPCSHMCACGAAFPATPDVSLSLNTKMTKCVFKYTIIERENATISQQEISKLKMQAVKQIMKYSHYRNKSAVKAYVEKNFNTGEGFALGKPLGYFSITHKGILDFSDEFRGLSMDISMSDSSDVLDLTH